MIVCHCEQVSDRTIKHAIAGGADSVTAITATCHAGGNCGGCVEELEALLLNMERRAERVPRWRRTLVTSPALSS